MSDLSTRRFAPGQHFRLAPIPQSRPLGSYERVGKCLRSSCSGEERSRSNGHDSLVSASGPFILLQRCLELHPGAPTSDRLLPTPIDANATHHHSSSASQPCLLPAHPSNRSCTAAARSGSGERSQLRHSTAAPTAVGPGKRSLAGHKHVQSFCNNGKDFAACFLSAVCSRSAGIPRPVVLCLRVMFFRAFVAWPCGGRAKFDPLPRGICFSLFDTV